MKSPGEPFPTMEEANEFHGLVNQAFIAINESTRRDGQPLDEMSKDWNLSLVQKIRSTGDSDLLRSIIKFASTATVSTIVMLTESLRAGTSEDVSHRISADVLTAIEAVRSAATLARWNREVLTPDDTRKVSEYVCQHPEDGALLVHLINDRCLDSFDEIISVLTEMKKIGAASLARGAL